MSVSVLLDGRDIGVRLQEVQVGIGEGSSKPVNDVPFVRNLRLGADLTSDGGDTGRRVNIVLEGYNVTPRDSALGLVDRDEGRGSGEGWENAEDDGEYFLGEHGSLEVELGP